MAAVVFCCTDEQKMAAPTANQQLSQPSLGVRLLLFIYLVVCDSLQLRI